MNYISNFRDFKINENKDKPSISDEEAKQLKKGDKIKYYGPKGKTDAIVDFYKNGYIHLKGNSVIPYQSVVKESIDENLNEARETVSYKGDTYIADFIKQKGYDGSSWHLLLKDTKTGNIYTWPDVFTYREGWTQGIGRSQHMYFLNTKGYGGVSQGDGVSRPITPSFITKQLEYILKHWKGDGYSDESIKWYKDNVQEFPKGTKKGEIKNSLS